jgi:hypothetical protein
VLHEGDGSAHERCHIADPNTPKRIYLEVDHYVKTKKSRVHGDFILYNIGFNNR